MIDEKPTDPSKRDFIVLSASAAAAIGAAVVALPLVDSLNPSADVRAQATIEVDLANILAGQTVTVSWQGKPIFIKHLTDEEIKEANEIAADSLRDPQTINDRVKKGHEKWLVMIGICTHLGCVPTINAGDYKGLFCPCHGSHYDGIGRIRRGPAPKNLVIPQYEFLTDTKIKIG